MLLYCWPDKVSAFGEGLPSGEDPETRLQEQPVARMVIPEVPAVGQAASKKLATTVPMDEPNPEGSGRQHLHSHAPVPCKDARM